MLSRKRLPLAALIEFCRVLRISLSAGITPRDVFRQLANRPSRSLRPIAERVGKRLQRGESLLAALEPESPYFPPLLIGLARVGEETGQLPEVLHELEKYYVEQQKYQRQLRSRSMLPVLQFFLAIGVVALLIFILGIIAESRGGAAPPVMGFRGASGAIRFLLLCAGLMAAVYLAYQLLTRKLGQQAFLDGLMLRLPVIGPCVEALVVGRFALAMQLTLDSAMPLARALRLSLDATGNAAFALQYDAIAAAVEEGEELTVALSRGQLMPPDFLSMVAVAEEGGRIVEIMRHQAAHYHEEASRRTKAATRLASGLIWLIYAGLMIAAIFGLASNILGGLGGLGG